MDITDYMQGFSALVAHQPSIILTLTIMSAIVVIGWTNFLCAKGHHIKKYQDVENEPVNPELCVKCSKPVKPPHTPEYIKFRRRKKLIILGLCVVTTIFSSPIIPPIATSIFFILGLVLAISTIGYDVIYKGIGGLSEKIMDNLTRK